MPDLAPAVLDAGDAWFEDSDRPAEGAVCGVCRSAAYVRLGSRLLALCGPDVAPGPLHLRVDPMPSLAVGQPVRMSRRRLEAGRLAVTLDPALRWGPRPVSAASLRSGLAAGTMPQDGWPADADVGLPLEVLTAARHLVERGDLLGLSHQVGGRGPGLTPAGDDLLAGVLVVHATLHPSAAPLRRRATEAAATTDVAAAFLRWAAAGQCIEPVHDLLEAVAAARREDLVVARTRVGGVGASSGAALLLGLRLALTT